MSVHCEIIRRDDPIATHRRQYVATQHCADYHQGCNNQVTVTACTKSAIPNVLLSKLRYEDWRFMGDEIVCPYCQAWREE